MRIVAVLLGLGAATASAQKLNLPRPRPAPPNAPASLVVRGAQVELRYQGATIFSGALSSTGATPRLRMLVDSSGGKITQIVSWTAGDDRVTLFGTVHGTRDAFAVD